MPELILKQKKKRTKKLTFSHGHTAFFETMHIYRRQIHARSLFICQTIFGNAPPMSTAVNKYRPRLF